MIHLKVIPVVFNKHNTARVASCWFIIYYRLVMHGNINICEKNKFELWFIELLAYPIFNIEVKSELREVL